MPGPVVAFALLFIGVCLTGVVIIIVRDQTQTREEKIYNSYKTPTPEETPSPFKNA